jgi:hypothetical protein
VKSRSENAYYRSLSRAKVLVLVALAASMAPSTSLLHAQAATRIAIFVIAWLEANRAQLAK